MKTNASILRRTALGAVLSLPLLSSGCLSAQTAGPSTAAPSPAGRAGTVTTTLVGTLSARMAIGGDTTGWALTVFLGGHARRIEVAFAPSCGGHPEDGSVIEATGHYATRNYLERGSIGIFVITSFRLFSGNVNEPAQTAPDKR